MRKLILASLFCLLLASPSWAVVAKVSSVSAGATAGNFTTGTFDTTGANFIACGVAAGHAVFPTFSDNMGNTFVTTLTRQVVSSTVADVQVIYIVNPTVGAGHTVTVTGAANLASIGCIAFSGVNTTSPFDVQNGAQTTSAVTLATGSIAATSGDLAVTVKYQNAGTSITIDNSFTIETSVAVAGGQHYGHQFAYKIDPGTVNPAWSWTTNAATATAIAAFLPAAGGGGGTAVQSSGGFMGSIIK